MHQPIVEYCFVFCSCQDVVPHPSQSGFPYHDHRKHPRAINRPGNDISPGGHVQDNPYGPSERTDIDIMHCKTIGKLISEVGVRRGDRAADMPVIPGPRARYKAAWDELLIVCYRG